MAFKADALISYAPFGLHRPRNSSFAHRRLEAEKLVGRYELDYAEFIALNVMKRYGISEIYPSGIGFEPYLK